MVTAEPSPGNSLIRVDTSSMNPITLGNLSPHSSELLPTFWVDPTLFVDKKAHYIVAVFAQNGETLENLYFREAKSGHGWASKYEVYRLIKGKSTVVKSVDWIEPTIGAN